MGVPSEIEHHSKKVCTPSTLKSSHFAEAVNVTYGQVDPQQDRNQLHKTMSLLCVLMPREPLKERKEKSSPLKKSKKTKSPQAIRLPGLEEGSG